MTDEKFETNLLRFVAAELYFSIGLRVAQEMFGKSYFSLGLGEKAAVDQAVLGAVGGNYQAMTQEFLMTQAPKPPVGFQPPAQAGSGS